MAGLSGQAKAYPLQVSVTSKRGPQYRPCRVCSCPAGPSYKSWTAAFPGLLLRFENRLPRNPAQPESLASRDRFAGYRLLQEYPACIHPGLCDEVGRSCDWPLTYRLSRLFGGAARADLGFLEGAPAAPRELPPASCFGSPLGGHPARSERHRDDAVPQERPHC